MFKFVYATEGSRVHELAFIWFVSFLIRVSQYTAHLCATLSHVYVFLYKASVSIGNRIFFNVYLSLYAYVSTFRYERVAVVSVCVRVRMHVCTQSYESYE